MIASDLGYYGPGAPATAHDALTCPPIYRGMAVFQTLIAGLRFKYDDGSELSAEDAWMNAGFGSTTPGMRNADLLQDLAFSRDGVFWIQRDAQNPELIVDAVHMPRETWTLDWLGNVVVNGREVEDQSQFIYFRSLMSIGLLEAAAESIENYLDIRRTIRSRGKNPIPIVEIHVTEEFNGKPEEIQKTQDRWAAARQSPNGAVAVTPPGIEIKIHKAEDAGTALESARNALRLDFANFLNQAASLLEGANGASGTYENTLQTKDELITLSLQMFLIPIQQRLSMPDITRSGKGIILDTSGLTASVAKGNLGTATPPIQGEITA